MSKVILTDCDEVLFDWSNPFEDWVRDNYPQFTPETSLRDHWHVEAWLGCEIEFSRQLIRDFNGDPDIWPYFEPLPGVESVIKQMADEGWKFVAITACAEDTTTYQGRWENLQSYFGQAFDTLHCVGLHSSKKDILARYAPTYWVEDKMKHASDGADVGHKSFLINYKHNANHYDPRVTRVDNWQEIYDQISLKEQGPVLV